MTDERLEIVLDMFEKAADDEDLSVTEESFGQWIDEQPDKDEIYKFFNDYVNGLITETKTRIKEKEEKENIEKVRLKLIEQKKI